MVAEPDAMGILHVSDGGVSGSFYSCNSWRSCELCCMGLVLFLSWLQAESSTLDSEPTFACFSHRL
ncbi:hypothetical protein MA16_Dca022979 [Dendrobium catenatum]|uniref:Uncharacterized protein n=1 Tax=Dendrobium catenatum TaxID=906689 RepID=A0A2I0VQF2_9ASPA|nr:hypothetical protein MA16_Dca022979 [Dendrobium catenatum]